MQVSGDREIDPRWQLAVRVSQSPQFCKANLLARLLLFLCEQTLKGSADDLTEQAIGEHVFRRRPGYSTGEDNIVRSYAHRLRSRLDQYFEQDGRHEPVRLRMPRGAYTVIFEENLLASENSSAAPSQLDIGEIRLSQPLSHPEPPRMVTSPADRTSENTVGQRAYDFRNVSILLMILLLLGGAVANIWTRQRLHATSTASPAHELWAQMFSGKNGAYIVTTDNGLGVLQDISGRYANLHNYIDGSYFAQFNQEETTEQRTLHRLSRERLTSVPDSFLASAMLLLPEASGRPIQLRNARSLQLNDLKQSNIVLLGSSYGDPWVTLFEPGLNFQLNYHAYDDTYKSEVINRHPLQGEQAVYINNSTSAPYTTYAVVALVPNLDQSGWVLLIEGLTMAGTEAAADFVLHGNISPFMREVVRNGSVRPFEVVLKTTNLDSQSSPPSILLKRIY